MALLHSLHNAAALTNMGAELSSPTSNSIEWVTLLFVDLYAIQGVHSQANRLPGGIPDEVPLLFFTCLASHDAVVLQA